MQWNTAQQQNKPLIHSETWVGQNYFAEWNKPEEKEYILYNPIYIGL